MIWSVDGMQWNIGCTVQRVAELQASDISGLMMDKSYFNDVIGTFLKYDIKLAVPVGMETEYNLLYDKYLADPVDGHTFVFPYAGGTVEVFGRVTNIKDVYVRMPDGSIHWKGITFSVIANHPTYTYTLDEVIAMGFAPLPDESSVRVGAVYQYGTSGWEEIGNAEDSYY